MAPSSPPTAAPTGLESLDVAALTRLLDRQAIWDCLLRYARGVDRMDRDLIRSAFWEDATNSHGPASGDVEEFIARWYPGQAARDRSFHLVSNQQLEFEPGGLSAHAEAYFVAAVREVDADEIELVGGRYCDLYAKRGNEWRIQTRLVVLDWQGLADSSRMNERLTTRHGGSRDRDDPSYERPVRQRPAIDVPWWTAP